MTCQNCGHEKNHHEWIDGPGRCDWGGSCPCTAYREPEPARKNEAMRKLAKGVVSDEMVDDLFPVTDLPDAAESCWVEACDDTDLMPCGYCADHCMCYEEGGYLG